MSANAAPWSVKGIDPKAREIAKDLARRSGMTLGEWLNSMIMDEPEEDDQVTTLPRRSAIPDPYDRRARSRRLDDAYAGPSLEVIADRLEAVERRSAEAIRSIEDAVSGLVRRIDRQENEQANLDRRFVRASDELRDGHQRLKKIEQSESSSVDEGRLLAVSERLDTAQGQTQAALRALELSFANLDNRLLQAESKMGPDETREASRFERLAETLSRQVEGNRIEMMRRLDVVEIESRADRLERALQNVSEQSRAAEQKSVEAVEAMGREVMRIAQNLHTRMERVEEGGALEQLGRDLGAKLERDLERHTQNVDLRLDRSDEQHARAIERLGDEITRISDRLSDRISASERRSSEAVEDITRRMADQSDRLELRHQMHSDLADRIRQSEERTAQLLSEARESMEQRAQKPVAPMPVMPAPDPSGLSVPAWSATEVPTSDWRSQAFGDPALWSDDDLDGLLDAAPFPSAQDEAVVAETPQADDPLFADTLETDVGAWVEARSLEADANSPFGSQAERADFGSLSQAIQEDDAEGLPAFEAAPDASLVFEAEAEVQPEPFVFETESDTLLTEAEASEVATESAPETGSLDAFNDASDATLFEREDDAILAALDDLLERPMDNQLTVEPSELFGQSEAELEFGSVLQRQSDDLLDTPFGGSAEAEPEERLSTRDALDAARAAMAEAAEPASRNAFGLKRKGGKSKLQEKLDKKASGEGSGFRKIFGASALAALVVGGGYGFLELSGAAPDKSGPAALGGAPGNEAPEVLAAVALSATPTEATPSTDIAATEGNSLLERATDLLDRGDDRGVEALKRAADLGHAGAQLRLAGLYEDGGLGVAVDETESRNWARRAAEGGDARAMHYYAMQLYNGFGGAQNRAAALGWLKRAAEAGRVDSQYNVARLYELGDQGVTKNPVEAFKWYMIAARRGDQQALASVQRLTPITDAEARRKAREAADAFTVDPVA